MSPLPKVIEVTHEQAYELADQLASKSVYEGTATTVFSGSHPEYGNIHVVIPPMGSSILLPALLPVVVQNLTL